ncbi:MAG: hypothetical protein ABSB49_15705 [Polyangia bacterium]|jgi:hypothetical protein
MRTRWILGLPLGLGLLLMGCGSGTKGGPNDAGSSPDVVGISRSPDTAIAPDAGDVTSQSQDAGGCSTAALPAPTLCPPDVGVNNAIINPCGAAQGGGTPVLRQNPAAYSTCNK